MAPGRYTELFFLDEAVALAAGHRPCAECRRDDYRRFLACCAEGNGASMPRAAGLDRLLHDARVDARTRVQRTYRTDVDGLPDGVFIRWGEAKLPYLLLGAFVYPFDSYAYGPPLPRPRDETIEVMTPRPTVNTLMAGYRPVLHPSAAP